MLTNPSYYIMRLSKSDDSEIIYKAQCGIDPHCEMFIKIKNNTKNDIHDGFMTLTIVIKKDNKREKENLFKRIRKVINYLIFKKEINSETELEFTLKNREQMDAFIRALAEGVTMTVYKF